MKQWSFKAMMDLIINIVTLLLFPLFGLSVLIHMSIFEYKFTKMKKRLEDEWSKNFKLWCDGKISREEFDKMYKSNR